MKRENTKISWHKDTSIGAVSVNRVTVSRGLQPCAGAHEWLHNWWSITFSWSQVEFQPACNTPLRSAGNAACIVRAGKQPVQFCTQITMLSKHVRNKIHLHTSTNTQLSTQINQILRIFFHSIRLPCFCLINSSFRNTSVGRFHPFTGHESP